MKNLNNINFFVSIESIILYNKHLTNTEKILYGVISAFSLNKDGYCYLKNSQIAEIVGIKERNLQYCLLKLIKQSYIIKIKKHGRVYYKTTTNAFIQMRERRKKNSNNNLIFDSEVDYDWLEEG